MFKISFLLILLGCDSRYPSTNLTGYENSRTIRTKRDPAVRTRKGISLGREALLQDEMFGRTSESGRSVRYTSWREDRNGTAHREQMDQTVQERGNQRSGDTSWPRTQAHHGLLGRGGCPSCDRTGPAERGQGTGGMATKDWKTALVPADFNPLERNMGICNPLSCLFLYHLVRKHLPAFQCDAPP